MIDAFKEAAKRKLKFAKVDDENTLKDNDYEECRGWQKVDEGTVLERKIVEVECGDYVTHVYIYDFDQSFLTIHILPGGDIPRTTFSQPFSTLENKIAIALAHRALTELGGTPPPLNDLLAPKQAPLQPVQLLNPVKIKKPDEQKPH